MVLGIMLSPQLKGKIYLYGISLAMFFWSTAATMEPPRRLRLRFLVFGVRMWLVNAQPRFTRPEADLLKRLAAPRFVLIFGITTLLIFVNGKSKLPNQLFFQFRGDDHIQIAPFDTRLIFYDGNILYLRRKTVNQSAANVHMGNFSSPEDQSDLRFVPFFEKTPYMLDFKLKVMIIRLGTKFHLFKLNMNLLLFGLLQFLALLVLELSVVHNPADGGNSGGRNLNKIKLLLFGHFKSLGDRYNTQRFAIRANYAYFRDPDGLVDVYCRFCYGDTSWYTSCKN